MLYGVGGSSGEVECRSKLIGHVKSYFKRVIGTGHTISHITFLILGSLTLCCVVDFAAVTLFLFQQINY